MTLISTKAKDWLSTSCSKNLCIFNIHTAALVACILNVGSEYDARYQFVVNSLHSTYDFDRGEEICSVVCKE